MKFFVPDSVADEVHEREVNDERIVGLRPLIACQVIDAIETGNCEQDDHIAMQQPYLTESFTAQIGIWSLVRHDGTGHRYAIVVCPSEPENARTVAEALLQCWNGDEEEEEEEDD